MPAPWTAGSASPPRRFEFSGGISRTAKVDFARYTWTDVNGDGVLDGLFKDGQGTAQPGDGPVRHRPAASPPPRPTAPPVTRAFEFVGGWDPAKVDTGQQIRQDTSIGWGGGADVVDPDPAVRADPGLLPDHQPRRPRRRQRHRLRCRPHATSTATATPTPITRGTGDATHRRPAEQPRQDRPAQERHQPAGRVVHPRLPAGREHHRAPRLDLDPDRPDHRRRVRRRRTRDPDRVRLHRAALRLRAPHQPRLRPGDDPRARPRRAGAADHPGRPTATTTLQRRPADPHRGPRPHQRDPRGPGAGHREHLDHLRPRLDHRDPRPRRRRGHVHRGTARHLGPAAADRHQPATPHPGPAGGAGVGVADQVRLRPGREPGHRHASWATPRCPATTWSPAPPTPPVPPRPRPPCGPTAACPRTRRKASPFATAQTCPTWVHAPVRGRDPRRRRRPAAPSARRCEPVRHRHRRGPHRRPAAPNPGASRRSPGTATTPGATRPGSCTRPRPTAATTRWSTPTTPPPTPRSSPPPSTTWPPTRSSGFLAGGPAPTGAGSVGTRRVGGLRPPAPGLHRPHRPGRAHHQPPLRRR